MFITKCTITSQTSSIDREQFSHRERKNKIADQIWGANPDYQKLPNTGLYFYSLLKIPSRDVLSSNNLVKQILFNANDKQLLDQSHLANLINAARAKILMNFHHLNKQSGISIY